MNRFGYLRATTLDEAFAALATPGAQLIAGGADLVPLLADRLAAPSQLVDIARIPELHGIRYSVTDVLWLGATTSLTEVMAHPAVQQHYGVLHQAIAESASPQIRNLATIGGNLLQKPRCAYYRDAAFACLRRDGGDLCSALAGDTSRHALFGYGTPDATKTCVAVHPSDAVNALAAMDAQVVLRNPTGERTVPISSFFVAPSTDPHQETSIAPNEIIVAIIAPPPPAGIRGTYIKLRDRASYEFAIVSAAAVIAEDAGVVSHARLVLGGVAWGPWRVMAAETALIGQPLTKENAAHAAQIALQQAQALPDNAYKIPMAQAALRRAILGEVHVASLASQEARA